MAGDDVFVLQPRAKAPVPCFVICYEFVPGSSLAKDRHWGRFNTSPLGREATAKPQSPASKRIFSSNGEIDDSLLFIYR